MEIQRFIFLAPMQINRSRGRCKPIPPLRSGAIWPINLLTKMKPPDFSHELNRLMDPYWRKARIAARLLIKREEGKPWSARDRRLAERLAEDNGVTNRLLDQAVSSRNARKKYGLGILG